MSLRRLFFFGLLIFGTAAYAGDDDLPSVQDLADSAAQRFPQPVRVGDLIHRPVLAAEESRPLLGRVHAVVKRRDGTLAVVMNYGGVLGFFSHPIAVPVNAMVLVGQDIAVAEYDPDQLKQFPAFDSASASPLPPDSIIRFPLGKPSH